MKQLIIFSLVGVIGFVVDATLTYIFASHLKFSPILAKLCAFPFAVTVTWFFNRKLTFSSQSVSLFHEWIRFFRVSLGGAIVNNFCFYLAVTYFVFFASHLIVAVAIGSVAGMMFNFIGARLYVFK